MTTKNVLAALAVAAALAGTAAAQTAPYDQPPTSPGSSPAKGDQARPSDDTMTREQAIKQKHERRRRAHETPGRMDPNRTFPGDLPERTKTPGSLDNEGRTDEGHAPVVPPPTTPPESRHGD